MIPILIKPYDEPSLKKAVERISEKYSTTPFFPCDEGRYLGHLLKETWVEKEDALFFNALADEELLVSWGVPGGYVPDKKQTP